MKKSVVVAVLLGMSASVYAGEAHVCGSHEVNALASDQGNVDDSTLFTCGGGVKGTIPELAKQGWKIVQVTDQVGTLSQTDPTKTTTYSRLIIQKD
ncbi:hypothetical protein [Pseudescherichia sp.]|uniref:hypothetical protein n=1 Tax=Pseudescherichia sp. TaxID=2055881 RepID=UPI002898A79E|nr:hypothetical protein [Pseudescherichia sp.]